MTYSGRSLMPNLIEHTLKVKSTLSNKLLCQVIFQGAGAIFTELVGVSPGLSQWISKISNMFDISPILHDSFQTVALPTWKLSCHRSQLLVSYTFCLVLYCNHIVLNSWPILVKYQDSSSRQAVNTNQPFLKANRPVVNITV